MNKIRFFIKNKKIAEIIKEYRDNNPIIIASETDKNEDLILITDNEEEVSTKKFKSSSIISYDISNLINSNNLNKFNNIIQIYEKDDDGKISISSALNDIIKKENKKDVYTYYFTCHSAIENIDYVTIPIKKIMENFKIDTDTYFYLNLILRELMLNAIEHGNKNNYKKNVELIFSLHLLDKICILAIKDEGEGFEWKNLLKKIKSEDILRNRHRGIFIIESIADKINVEKNKISIQLHFKERK